MDHDDIDIESWLYEANHDLDEATAAEVDVETTLAEIKRVAGHADEVARRQQVRSRFSRWFAEPPEVEPGWSVAARSAGPREDVPEYADPPSRFDVGGLGAALFGGPSATLYGDPGLAAPVQRASGVPLTVPGHGIATPDEVGSLARPYAKTGGRAREHYDLHIEALVSTSERGREQREGMRPAHWAICRLCLDTRSVAEVAALLRMPLGVARVVIGDMAGLGLVVVHHPPADGPSTTLLMRVRDGLASLDAPLPVDAHAAVDSWADAPTEVLPVYHDDPTPPPDKPRPRRRWWRRTEEPEG